MKEEKILTHASAYETHVSIQEPLQDKGFDNYTPLAVLQDLQWLKEIVHIRAKELLEAEALLLALPKAPKLEDGPYKNVVDEYALDDFGRLLLITGFAALYSPETFSPLLITDPISHQLPSNIGGQYSKMKNQFSPTFRTALFLFAGTDDSQYSSCLSTLHRGHVLLKEQIIYGKSIMGGSNFIANDLIEIDEEYLAYFLDGTKPRLDHGHQFPASLISTNRNLDDLIVKDSIKGQFKPIIHYMKAKISGYFDDHDRFEAGYVVLLHGPSGTGKTFSATILGNILQLDVYKVDLSTIISKYIGETEKNLKTVFDRLQGKNCILYFDEADALFGKRSEVSDAKDRYANQEVSYLLQRVEEFDGLTILSTNFENNIDEAFMRRINVKINMSRPEEKERVMLWTYYTPEKYTYETKELQLYLALEYAFTGANIKNILNMITMELHNSKQDIITYDNILPYLKIECEKAFGVNYQISSYYEFLNR